MAAVNGYFPLLALAAVLVVIAARKIGRFSVRIWQAMAGGALLVLLSGAITPAEALRAIEPDVMVFLFGMFVLGEALVESGALYAAAYAVLDRIRSTDVLVLALLYGSGIASALLMNDTVAVIGTALALQLAREHRIDARLLLLTLAFGITIGSVASPIGNPQNLLIAVRGPVPAPFLTFAEALAVPTLLNLLLTYGVLRWRYRAAFHRTPLVHPVITLRDARLARLAWTGVAALVVAIVLRTATVALIPGFDVPLSAVALAGALPVLLFSPRRRHVLRSLDWSTLVFFAAMFVLMASVWQTGIFQQLGDGWAGRLAGPSGVLGVSVLFSQLLSNVPLVALYLPYLQSLQAETSALLALAAGSTIAGNLLILGAASNVIIIQRAERHGETLGFMEFARTGIPVTCINLLVYALYLRWLD
jgi:Na+/H+ antiporter NhaD/arsenite permease-like protein